MPSPVRDECNEFCDASQVFGHPDGAYRQGDPVRASEPPANPAVLAELVGFQHDSFQRQSLRAQAPEQLVGVFSCIPGSRQKSRFMRDFKGTFCIAIGGGSLHTTKNQNELAPRDCIPLHPLLRNYCAVTGSMQLFRIVMSGL